MFMPDTYTATSIPRNREIMRIFKDLDFFEQLGSGVPKIVEKYGRGVFTVSKNVLQTILTHGKNSVSGDSEHPGETEKDGQENGKKRARNHPEEFGGTVEKTVEKILSIIAKNPEVRASELVDLTGLGRRGIEWNLKKLKSASRRRIAPRQRRTLGCFAMPLSTNRIEYKRE